MPVVSVRMGACLVAVASKDDGSAVRPRICALESTNPSA